MKKRYMYLMAGMMSVSVFTGCGASNSATANTEVVQMQTEENTDHTEKKEIPVTVVRTIKENVTVVVNKVQKNVNVYSNEVVERVKHAPVICEVPQVKNYVNNYVNEYVQNNTKDSNNTTVVNETTNVKNEENNNTNIDNTQVKENTFLNFNQTENKQSETDENQKAAEENAKSDAEYSYEEETGEEDQMDMSKSEENTCENTTEYTQYDSDQTSDDTNGQSEEVYENTKEENDPEDQNAYDYTQNETYTSGSEYTEDADRGSNTDNTTTDTPNNMDTNSQTTSQSHQESTAGSWCRKGKYSNGYWAMDITDYDLDKGTVTFDGYEYAAGEDTPVGTGHVATIVDKDTLSYCGVSIHWTKEDTFTFANKNDVMILSSQVGSVDSHDVDHGDLVFKK